MTISKGEVWLVNLDPTLGDEIRKMRPAIVVSRDALGCWHCGSWFPSPLGKTVSKGAIGWFDSIRTS